MDHDLGWVVGIFHREKLLDRLVAFLSGLVRVNRDDTALVAAFEERVAADRLHKRIGVDGVLRHHQHERLDDLLVVLARVDFELHLGVLVDADAIFELQRLQPLFIVVGRVEILARRNGGFLDEPIVQGAG